MTKLLFEFKKPCFWPIFPISAVKVFAKNLAVTQLDKGFYIVGTPPPPPLLKGSMTFQKMSHLGGTNVFARKGGQTQNEVRFSL